MITYYGNKITWIPEIKKSNKPLFILIAECLEKDIESGKLKCGFKLPPQRIIANYLGISHSTVTRAYTLCEERGLIKGIIGKGTFVSSNAGIPSHLFSNRRDDNVIEMGMVLPVYEMNELLQSYITGLYNSIDYDLVLRYSPPEGHIKHRYIASKWLEQYRIKSGTDNILITSGSQNALAVILVSLFAKGDRIVVDELTYPGLKSLAKLLGIILVPVKGDKLGMDIEELMNTCKRESVKGIYLIPDCHNPTTITMPLDRRREIGKIIDDSNMILIEDGTFSFCAEDRLIPISSIFPDNSFYIHGTTKALNPTFRISYIVAPRKYVNILKHSINNLTWMPSPLTAEIVSLLQATSKYDDIINIKLNLLKKRNQIADDMLREFDLVASTTSLFRYLSLPKDFDDVEAEHHFMKAGIQVFSSKRFSTGMDNKHNAIRISVSSPKNESELVKGFEIIRDVIKSYQYKYDPIV